tara:strand:+ start:228 stop:434 length:207 start_codon:yes stop_codon:yes gene_type:complete
MLRIDYIKLGIIRPNIEDLQLKIDEAVSTCINGSLAIGEPLEVEAGISPDLLKLWDLEEELQTAQEAK